MFSLVSPSVWGAFTCTCLISSSFSISLGKLQEIAISPVLFYYAFNPLKEIWLVTRNQQVWQVTKKQTPDGSHVTYTLQVICSTIQKKKKFDGE